MKRTSTRTGSRTVRNGRKAVAMAAELPAAAFLTIAHRLPMIFAAAADPKARASPELTRMVSEKTSAATRSAAAAGKGATKASEAISRYWAKTGARTRSKSQALKSPQGFADLLWRQAWANAEATTKLTAALIDVTASTAAETLTPAHRAATANAKRLAAKKAPSRRGAKGKSR